MVLIFPLICLISILNGSSIFNIFRQLLLVFLFKRKEGFFSLPVCGPGCHEMRVALGMASQGADSWSHFVTVETHRAVGTQSHGVLFSLFKSAVTSSNLVSLTLFLLVIWDAMVKLSFFNPVCFSFSSIELQVNLYCVGYRPNNHSIALGEQHQHLSQIQLIGYSTLNFSRPLSAY